MGVDNTRESYYLFCLENFVTFLFFQNPFYRLMYWCNRGVDHKIEVANMDGDDRRVLVRRGLYYPNGLTLDDTNNRLYWVDSYFDSLEYYDLQRHTITTLLDRDSIFWYPFGLTSLDDYLYWTDQSRDAVYQADKSTASNSKILVSGLDQPRDIHAYDRSKTLPGNITRPWLLKILFVSIRYICMTHLLFDFYQN